MDRTLPANAAASFVAAFVLVVVLAATAGSAAGVGAPTPTATPVVSPTQRPSPTAAPTNVPGSFVVDLDAADTSDVTVVVDDASGVITGVASGRAADGMSVRWGDIVVQNLDEDTLRLTWAGWPMDEVITVSVVADGDGLALTFTQKMPDENTDAMGADRVLLIDVAAAVQAEDVSARFVPGA